MNHPDPAQRVLDPNIVTLAFEFSRDGIQMLALDGRLLMLNAGAAATMGFDGPDGPVGLDWITFWHGAEREARAAVEAAAGGRRATMTGHRPMIGGTPRWLESTLIPVMGQEGRPVSLLVVSRDITAQREAERACRRSELLFQSLVDATSGIVWRFDSSRRSFDCRGWRAFTGRASDPNDLEAWLNAIHPDDRDRIEHTSCAAFATEQSLTAEYRLPSRSGGWRWVEDHATPVKDDDGLIVGWIGVVTDIHDRTMAETKLRDDEAKLTVTEDALRSTLRRYEALLDATSVSVWHSNAPQTRCERQGWTEFTGRPVAEADGGWLDSIHPDDRDRTEAERDRALLSGTSYANEYRLNHVDGGYRWVSDDVVPLRGVDGSLAGWVGVISDIHDRRMAEQALRISEQRLRLASEVTGLGTYDVNMLTGERDWSPEFYTLLRISRATRPDRRVFLAGIHPDDRARVERELDGAEAPAGRSQMSTFRLLFKDGEERWMEARERTFHSLDGRPTRRIGTMQDITDRKQAERDLWLAAHADALTGVANRALFQTRLDRAIADADAQRGDACLLLIDIDRFKDVNDMLGHDAGDALLRTIAQRLLEHVPSSGTVARLGGDEFGIIVPWPSGAEEPEVIVSGILESLRRPVIHGGREVDCSASIGWSMYPRHDPQAAALLKNADIALYAAKRAGRGRSAAFTGEMRDDLQRRMTVLRLAKDALLRNTIVPFYQPKASLPTGRIVGFEALLRWRSDDGLQSPGSIADAFDDPELANQLGARMLNLVISDMSAWTKAGVPFGHVALNVAAPEFHGQDFSANILAALREGRIRPEQFEIEVTEGVLLDDDASSAVGRALKTLDAAGISVSLDDFGTGYASLTHLKRFPVSWLKVDRSFVSNMEADEGCRAIVEAVVGLAHNLGLKTVAEGIETPSQLQLLARMGCDLAQGYLIAKPMAASRVPGFLASWTGLDAGCRDARTALRRGRA